jgi:Flp pilus assembly protein TadD
MGTTREAASAVFRNVGQGEFDAEVQAAGYQNATEHITIAGFTTNVHVYVYMTRESDPKADSARPGGTVMSPKLQGEVDKGLEALEHRRFEAARAHFAKGAVMAPGNPELQYWLGVAEQALHHQDLARQDFEKALSLDPGHERSLVALGELQLDAGETALAITTLEKAYRINGAGWRTQYLLAAAYAKSARFSDAETYAQHAVSLAKENRADPLLLLGEIQAAQRKFPDARQSWQKLVTDLPNASAAQKAKQYLARTSIAQPAAPPEQAAAALPLHPLANLDLASPAQRPWAPLDVDSVEFPLARDAPCGTDEVLRSASQRLRSQLKNFEKFTATEHIEHQEIDRYGQPGPVLARDFSYVVFVYPYEENSFFLDERRDNQGKGGGFPTSLATIGLNNLGVAILQPAAKDSLIFRCEGLSTIRGHAAWQIHFQEKETPHAPIREWRRGGKIYHIPEKGRAWISSTSFDLLRVETDLREPVVALQLTRDHLSVDYGPVTFHSQDTTLWLPWNAEMYTELHGRRYHHRHYLTDYLLFEVDTSHKIAKPKNAPPPVSDNSETPETEGNHVALAPWSPEP